MAKKNRTAQSAASGLDSNTAKYTILFSATILAIGIIDVLFLQGQTSMFIQRSWGMNNFSYYPIWIEILVFVLLICSIVPAFNSRMVGLLERLSEWITEKGMKKGAKIMSFAGITFALTVLLYVFKIKYAFLGDRDIRVDQSVRGIYVTDEYLTMYLLHYLNNIMASILHFTPHRSFVFHSIASGFIYFFINLLIADLLFEKTEHKIIFFLFSISIATIMVFSGYVEIYAFPAASVSLYVYSCLLFLKNKTKLILPFLLLVLAIALHLEQVSLIPSFVFLAVSRYKFSDKIGIPLLVSLAIVAIPVIYIVYPIFHIDASTVVPLKPSLENPGLYTLISTAHFNEFFNSQFLSSGVLVLLLPVALFVSYQRKVIMDVYSKFFLLLLLFSVVIVFTDNTMMGSADWDICSFPAISASMFIPYIFLKLFDKIYAARKISYILVAALVFNTLNCWAWVGINSADMSIKKIRDMIATDPGYYYNVYMPGEIHLTATYNACNLTEEANKSIVLAYEKYAETHSRASYQYVVLQLKQNDTLGAITTLKKMLTKFPLAEFGMVELTFLYEKKHMYSEEYQLGLIVERLYGRNPQLVAYKLGKPFLNHIFSYVYESAVNQKDETNAQKASQLKQSLVQIADGPPAPVQVH